MKRSSGLTIIELLVAISVIAIAFMLLAQSQIFNLRSTMNQQDQTVAKASAVRKLEELSNQVLKTETRSCLDPATALYVTCTYYFFEEYLTACPTATSTDSRCSEAGVTTSWRVQAESGLQGEGLILITVTAQTPRAAYTVAQRVSCYDVYPAPSRDTPKPCPVL